MRELEIGDTAVFTAEVDILGDLHCRVRTANGDKVWVPRDQLQLVESPPFSVDDEVETRRGAVGTIDKITPQGVLCRVIDDDGSVMGMFSSDRLTHWSPPKPEYRVIRKDDSLGLQRIHGNPDGNWSVHVFLSESEAIIKSVIASWAHDHGIDADEAWKLAAKPQIIDKRVLGLSHYATAIRTGNDWHVTLTAKYVADMDSTYLPGDPQDESTGKGIFPTIKGRYEVRT